MNTILNLFVAAVVAGTPLLFGTVGEIVNEKAGHLNLGVEGMMAMGACAGFVAGFFTNNIVFAIMGAFLAGAFGALIYAFLTVTLLANQNVTGLTLTIFGVGLSNFMGEYVRTTALPAGEKTLKLPPAISSQLLNLQLPMLSDIPVLGKLLFSYNIFVYLGIAVAIAAGIYLGRTRTGRNLRAVGENPAAADAAGIKVVKLKYLNLLLGGGICGIGGAYASLIISGGVWIANSVNGLGWISVALVIFATWSPTKAILGSFIFGIFKSLKYYIPKTGALSLIPLAFFDMLPFLMTAVVLVATSIRQSREKSQPAGCGVNYYREER